MNSQKGKMKLNIKKIFIFLFLILIILFIIYKFIILKDEPSSTSGYSLYDFVHLVGSDNSEDPNKQHDSKYGIIKQDINENYSGIGQEKVKGKDGYFTTFTTVEKNKKRYIEYKQNGTSSWANNPYWDNTMETDGCGITAMSIIISGYSNSEQYTPEVLRQRYFPVLDAEKISSELSKSYKIPNSGFLYDSVSMSESQITKQLLANKPVLVCVWHNLGDNRWTKVSHYIVLLAADENGMWYVSNPNGLEDNSKSSGWYPSEEIAPYIAKVLFIEK